jgi:GNAT superfamily N-acetyltransferase
VQVAASDWLQGLRIARPYVIPMCRQREAVILGALRNARERSPMTAEHCESVSSRTVTLRDGASILVRPIGPEDKSLLLDGFERLSEDSRYRRFFMSLSSLSPRMLAYFTEVDHSDREAIIAIEPRSSQALGVARYGRLSEDPEAAEVAVAVVDDWHRRGVARALLAELSARAQDEGLRRFVALVQADNRDALALFGRVSGSKPRLTGPTAEFVIELGPGKGWSSNPR